MAGIAAGQLDLDTNFIGAAYGSDLICVKLRSAKNNLRDFYGVSSEVPAYSSADIILGIQYALTLAGQLDRPLVLSLALTTNLGAHDGSDPIEQYIGRLANTRGICVITPAGNETGRGKHYRGTLNPNDVVEFFVAENETSILLNFVGNDPDSFSVSLESPIGNTVERLPRSIARLNRFPLIGESTQVSIRYYDQDLPRAYIRLDTPTSGIWRIQVFGDRIINGTYDIWLPIQNFSQSETRFLSPSPDITVTVPGTQPRVITVGGYDPLTNRIYEQSGRGPTRTGFIRPSFLAPAVDIYGPSGNTYRSITGTSAAVALTAGAAAQFLQWGIVEGNNTEMNTLSIQSQMLRCATRQLGLNYPNNSQGYGILNVSSCI